MNSIFMVLSLYSIQRWLNKYKLRASLAAGIHQANNSDTFESAGGISAASGAAIGSSLASISAAKHPDHYYFMYFKRSYVKKRNGVLFSFPHVHKYRVFFVSSNLLYCGILHPRRLQHSCNQSRNRHNVHFERKQENDHSSKGARLG